jgi:hypothetical protein
VSKAKPDVNNARAAADRYRQLLVETTTAALAQYLRKMIVRCEALARGGEASD